MYVVSGDLSRARGTALTLAAELADQVALLEDTPLALRGDQTLAHDLAEAVLALRAQVAGVGDFAAALGATATDITAVDQRLARAVPLAASSGGRLFPSAVVRLGELAGTLTAEAVVHALPPESRAIIDPVAAAIPDGPGWAAPVGSPIRTTPPDSAAGWLNTIAEAQTKPGQIEVTHLDNGRWVVSLPGIHSFTEAADPLDLPGAAHAYGAGHGAYAGAVVMALTLAGVPSGARLMLVGHSQGGIVAADLAADPTVAGRWQIDQLLTAAAPIDDTPLPPQTGVLALRNRDDIVPELDLRSDTATPPEAASPPKTAATTATTATTAETAGRPALRASIAFDAERGNIGANHDLAATYVPYARSSEFAADPAVRAWEAAAKPYLTGGAATTQRFQLLDRSPTAKAGAEPPSLRTSGKE